MTEDGQDAQAPARRAPPREPGQLREGLAAADGALGMRRVPPARATNDGNLAAERQRQAVPSQAPNDGKFVQAPPVRERRVPSDPGRAPAPLAPVAFRGLPRVPTRAVATADDSSSRDSFPSVSKPGQRANRASAAEGPAAEDDHPISESGATMPRGTAPAAGSREELTESAFVDGEFVGFGASATREASDGDDQDDDPEDSGRVEFGSMPEAARFRGRTGEPEAPRHEPVRVSQMLTPWAPERPDPVAPKGPDFDHKRLVLEAIQSASDARRRARQQKQDGTDAAGDGDADGAQRMSGMLQSAKTYAAYLDRGKQLLKRYKRENGVQFADEDVDPREFVSWLIGMRPFLSTSPWRTYRLSASAIIQSIPHDRIDEAIATLNGANLNDDAARPVYKKMVERDGGNTSSVRAKRMELAHFRKLRANLRRITRSNKVDWLDDWLVAGIHTGLRPSEWPLAHLEIRRDGKRRLAWLHVVNAKATQGRANGTHRTLDISSYTDATLEAIERMVKRSEQWALEGNTVRRQSEVSQLFYQICNALFPRMQVKYSLYSLRHQFIANMKEVYQDPAKVATLIGHISIETQSEHYGKRRSSWGLHDIREIPKPLDEQVAQVQKYLAAFEERAHLRLMRKAFADGRDLVEDFDQEEDDLDFAADMAADGGRGIVASGRRKGNSAPGSSRRG
jgi:hypothetical protein